MSVLFVFSFVVQWVLLLGLCAGMLVIARQIGLLHRRLPPRGARSGPMGPSAGEKAPPFHEEALDGSKVTLGAERGRRTLLVFMSADCPGCELVAPAIRSVAKSERRLVDVVLASLDDAESTRVFLKRHDLGSIPTVVSYSLRAIYQVDSSPYGVMIDERGVVRGKGLVNSLDHLDSLLQLAEHGNRIRLLNSQASEHLHTGWESP